MAGKQGGFFGTYVFTDMSLSEAKRVQFLPHSHNAGLADSQPFTQASIVPRVAAP